MVSNTHLLALIKMDLLRAAVLESNENSRSSYMENIRKCTVILKSESSVNSIEGYIENAWSRDSKGKKARERRSKVSPSYSSVVLLYEDVFPNLVDEAKHRLKNGCDE